MSKWTFSQLTSEHAAAWQLIRLEGARDFPLGFLVSEEDVLNTSMERAKEILELGAMYGVFNAQELIGFCGFRPQQLTRTRHRAELGPFFITRKYHGSGAAKVLLDGAILEARKEGVERLELFVDTQNVRAIAFYERHGFRKFATLKDTVRIDGQSCDDHIYTLPILKESSA